MPFPSLDAAKKKIATDMVNAIKSMGVPERVNQDGVTLTWDELHTLLASAYLHGARGTELSPRYAVINCSGERTQGTPPLRGRVVSLHATANEAWDHVHPMQHDYDRTVGCVGENAVVGDRVAYFPTEREVVKPE